MTENNKRQAYLPDDAVLIENPVGTAPSFAVEHEGKVVISLPGVPREMKFLLKEKVIPYLLSKYTLGIIKARILKAAGIGESSLDDLIGADLLEKSNPTIGLAAHQGQVDIRITAKADTEDIADAMIAEMETSVRERAGEFIFGTDEETLESVFVAMLKAQGAKVGIVQAGIGAVLSDGLRTVDGGDDIIALVENYGDPAMLRRQYDLSADLTLREAGREIAKHVYENNDVALSIVIASLPDIDEGEDQSESTVITVYTPDETAERVYGFGGRSSLVREWLPRWALSRAWRMLQAKADA